MLFDKNLKIINSENNTHTRYSLNYERIDKIVTLIKN